MLNHISTYENIKTNEETYILFDDETGNTLAINGDVVTYAPEWDAPQDIDYLNDPNYELIYIDSNNIEAFTDDYKEELTPEANQKICRYLLEKLKKIANNS